MKFIIDEAKLDAARRVLKEAIEDKDFEPGIDTEYPGKDDEATTLRIAVPDQYRNVARLALVKAGIV